MSSHKLVISKTFPPHIQKRLLNNDSKPFDINFFEFNTTNMKSNQLIDFIVILEEKTISINTIIIENKMHYANIRRGKGFQDVPVYSYSLLCTETLNVLSTKALKLISFSGTDSDYTGQNDIYNERVAFTINSDEIIKRFNTTLNNYQCYSN